MNAKLMSAWTELGERLALVSPDKFDDVLEKLTAVVEAQELIAQFDHQLFLRGRPRKRYQA